MFTVCPHMYRSTAESLRNAVYATGVICLGATLRRAGGAIVLACAILGGGELLADEGGRLQISPQGDVALLWREPEQFNGGEYQVTPAYKKAAAPSRRIDLLIDIRPDAYIFLNRASSNWHTGELQMMPGEGGSYSVFVPFTDFLLARKAGGAVILALRGDGDRLDLVLPPEKVEEIVLDAIRNGPDWARQN